jgi:integrase
VNARRRQANRRNWPANLYQNADGYFWFRNPVTKKTAGCGTDLQKAIKMVKAANLGLEKLKAERDLLAATSDGLVTLASHCDAYEKEFAVGKTNTIKAIKSQLNAIRKSESSKKAIDQFTPKDAADLIKEAVENRGATMAQAIRRRLKDVYRDAILHGLVKDNPVDVVLNPKTVVTRARMSESDFWAIFEKAEDRWLKNAMLLALLTGQRKNDILRMKFEDAKDGYLWVDQQKTGAKIKIELTVALGPHALQNVIAQCRDKAVSRYLVHFPAETYQHKRGAKVGEGSLEVAFRRAREKADLIYPDGATPTTFHEIRSLAARLHAKARNSEFAQALLGHSSAGMTELYKDVRGQQWVEVKAG